MGVGGCKWMQVKASGVFRARETYDESNIHLCDFVNPDIFMAEYLEKHVALQHPLLLSSRTSEWGRSRQPESEVAGSADGEERELGPGPTAPHHRCRRGFPHFRECFQRTRGQLRPGLSGVACGPLPHAEG